MGNWDASDSADFMPANWAPSYWLGASLPRARAVYFDKTKHVFIKKSKSKSGLAKLSGIVGEYMRKDITVYMYMY